MFKRTEMNRLRTREMQTHWCQSCGNWLEFCFDPHKVTIDDVDVEILDMPVLRCDKCSVYYLPDKTEWAVRCTVKKAREQGQSAGILSLDCSHTKRYNLCPDVAFLYDHVDYEYIPGLWRSSSDGFLTPVFFNLAVLNKYSQHPSYHLDLFSRTYGSIEKPSEFHMAFGINRSKQVVMWLGDIDKEIPVSEQHYLRSENVESDHDIHSEFYEAQIEVKFSEPSPETALFHLRAQVNETCRRKRGAALHVLSGEVDEVLSNLNRPVFWTEAHVAPVINALNCVFVESLNDGYLKEQLLSVCTKGDLKGLRSMKLLEKWLGAVLRVQDPGKIACPFYVLYDFRVVTSHLIPDDKMSSELEFINRRLGIDPKNTKLETIYDKLFGQLIESYKAIAVAL